MDHMMMMMMINKKWPFEFFVRMFIVLNQSLSVCVYVVFLSCCGGFISTDSILKYKISHHLLMSNGVFLFSLIIVPKSMMDSNKFCIQPPSPPPTPPQPAERRRNQANRINVCCLYRDPTTTTTCHLFSSFWLIKTGNL